MFTAEDPTPDHRFHRLRGLRLHNFLFPNQVSWGSKRILRRKSPVTAPSNLQLQLQRTLTPSSMEEADRTPWNLRSRRSTCDSPARDRNPNPKCSSPAEKEMNRVEFSVSLSPEEIEEDFIRLKGRKPYRRPKKRARIVQKKLDSLFPGLWLQEITTESYKMND